VTFSGTSTGATAISFAIGSNVTNLIKNDNTTSTLTLNTANANQALAINEGTVVGTTSATAFGTGAITLGDSAGGSATLQGSTFTYTNSITLGASAVGTLTIGSFTTTSAPTFSGTIGLNGNNLTLNKQGTTGTATFGGAISGTGNLTVNNNTSSTGAISVGGGGITNVGNIILNNNSAGAGALTIATSVNNTGNIQNTGTSAVNTASTISATVGANVTDIIQNSTLSMSLAL
jgi:hypothetical protein